MESDYKFRYVNDYITNLLDGNMTLQYEDVDLKSVKKPIAALNKNYQTRIFCFLSNTDELTDSRYCLFIKEALQK